MLLEVLIVIGINSCINRDSNSISNSCRNKVIAAALIVLVIVIIIFIVITRFGRPHDSLGPSVERVKHLANGFGYWGHASVPQALLKRQLYVDWFQTTKDNTICL